jgi:hypothetical protein
VPACAHAKRIGEWPGGRLAVGRGRERRAGPFVPGAHVCLFVRSLAQHSIVAAKACPISFYSRAKLSASSSIEKERMKERKKERKKRKLCLSGCAVQTLTKLPRAADRSFENPLAHFVNSALLG